MEYAITKWNNPQPQRTMLINYYMNDNDNRDVITTVQIIDQENKNCDYLIIKLLNVINIL